MKTISVKIIVLAMALSGCRKHANTYENKTNINIPVGTIVAKIDGVETTFNIDSKADTITEPFDFWSDIYRLEITGKNTNLVNSQKINIKFWAKPVRAIDNGTYTDLNKQIYNYIDYYIDTWKYSANGYDPYLTKATIVKNDSLVQGTFSGKLIIGYGPAIDQPQPPLSHTVESGMFNVKMR